MQRTVRATAVFGCFFILLISTLAAAQQNPQVAVPASKTPSFHEWNCDGAPWTIKKGVCVANIPRLHESQPEFAILALTPEQRRDFESNPVVFLNQHEVFAHPVNHADISFLTPHSETTLKLGLPTERCYAAVGHWPSSNAKGKEFPASDPMPKGAIPK